MFEEAGKNGYIPHGGMAQATCAKCGNGTFETFPQGMPAEGTWVYEFACTRCGAYLGIQVKRD